MQTPAAFIRGVKHPEAFHGLGVSKKFFEGWYIKLVSFDSKQRWAVIPGIFKGLDGGADLAFIQVLDGATGRSWFHEFEPSEFEAATDHFSVRVGENRFDATGVTLHLTQLSGRIDFTDALDPWPVTLASPGIMGWYGMVPFMECFHGIVSFGHGLRGDLRVEGVNTDFSGGRSYIEKDWGKAFPAGYVWMQSNHFATDPSASLVASVAIIPWLASSFRGFIIGFRHSGKLHKWATYNKAQEQELAITDTHVHWRMTGPDGTLEIEADRVAGGLLHAPLRTAMYQRVEETMLSRISVRHLNLESKEIFKDVGEAASLEVYGDLAKLLAVKTR